MSRRPRANPRFQDFGPADWDKFFKPGKPPMLPYAPLGSISEGSLDDYDLLRAFAWALDKLAHRQTDPLTRRLHEKLVRRANQTQDRADSLEENENDDADDVAEEIVEINEELSDALEAYAPPYGYFGASPGDGADFGFWIDVDAVNNAIRDARHDAKAYPDEEPLTLVVEDTDDVPDHFSGEVFLVSDHGNVTFYECSLGALVEIWSII